MAVFNCDYTHTQTQPRITPEAEVHSESPELILTDTTLHLPYYCEDFNLQTDF